MSFENKNMLPFVPDMYSGVWCKLYVTPVPKPRMTQRDKWKKRNCVLNYYSFKDNLKLYFGNETLLPKNITICSWIAYLPFPKSYSEKKRYELSGCPHTLKPDKDNIEKAIFDSLFTKDQFVYAGFGIKYWEDSQGPRLELLFK